MRKVVTTTIVTRPAVLYSSAGRFFARLVADRRCPIIAGMVNIDIQYVGQLGTTATHGPSGTALGTDAPVDNMGRGLSFSPTDLLATSLGTCMLTTMAIVAGRNKIAFDAGQGRVGKAMTATGPRRVDALEVVLRLPASVAEADRPKLESAAHNCPVAKSLHPDVKVTVAFDWTL